MCLFDATKLLLCAAVTIIASAQVRLELPRAVSAAEYFGMVPFPENCPSVPFQLSTEEAEAIAHFRSKAATPLLACKSYAEWLAQKRPRLSSAAQEEVSIATALASDPNFRRESKATQEWLNVKVASSQKEILREFLNDATIRSLRTIGPQTNWSLLLELPFRPERSFADLKEDIDIGRFQNVARTATYGKLSNDLKDYVAAHLLSSDYVSMAPTVEKIREAEEAGNRPVTRVFYQKNTLLTNLIKGGKTTVESIFKVDSKAMSLFHQLNDTVKADLVSLLFVSWDARERDSWLSVYSQQPVSRAERGFYAMVNQSDGSGLEFLRGLSIPRFSRSDLRIIMYSLLEGGSMGDASELRKRTRYFKGILQLPLFQQSSGDVKTRLLQASRIPAVGASTSGKTFDFREDVSHIFEVASSLENPTSFLLSLTNLYERMRVNWFLTPGNPALLYTHYSPYPTLDERAYEQARLYVLFPDKNSVKQLDDVPMEVQRQHGGSALTVDYDLFPKRPYRAGLGGAPSRRWSDYEGMRFQTEDVHVTFDDHHDITIRVPTTQKVSPDSQPPKLAMVISALGLIRGPLRRQPSEILLIPVKKYTDKKNLSTLLAFYLKTKRSLNFLQVSDDGIWKRDFAPAETLFHEYGHVIFFQNLKLADKNSPLIKEYRRAVIADRADISEYGRESLSEDFSESLALRQLLKSVPSHDLENAFEILYPNRHAFFQTYARALE